MQAALPAVGFLRLKQIVGDRKQGIPAIIPVSRSAWLDGVKAGNYPAPVRLGPNTVAWNVGAIRDLIERLQKQPPAGAK